MTVIDMSAIDNAGGGIPWDHLRPYPADGTLLRVLAGTVYRVQDGVASLIPEETPERPSS